VYRGDMTRVFHYAPWAYLPQIVTSGALLPNNAGAEVEVPLLWFSANQQWEPTAGKTWKAEGILMMTFRQQLQRAGCIRFGLPAADMRLLCWKDACAVAGIPREARRNLERSGKKRGAEPSHWFAIAQPMPLTELDLEVFGEEAWQPADPSEMAEVWTKCRSSPHAR
jgi:hypothetical protein